MQELILTHQIQINKLKSESNLTLEDLKSKHMQEIKQFESNS